MLKLKVAATFLTVDGECTFQGPLQWTTFIRLGGCNLRCWKSTGYCDAPHTLDMTYGYPEYTFEQLLGKLHESKPCMRVTITGGEPLMQRDVVQFARFLKDHGYTVTMETSGSLDMSVEEISPFAAVIADLKPPSTEMAGKMVRELFLKLRKQDFVKVVLQHKDDYEWAKNKLASWNSTSLTEGSQEFQGIRAQIAMGVRHGYLELKQVAEWIRKDKLFHIMLNMQAHKHIWPDQIPTLVGELKLMSEAVREKYVRAEV